MQKYSDLESNRSGLATVKVYAEVRLNGVNDIYLKLNGVAAIGSGGLE